MNCLIVEDEPLAAGILEEYIREVSFLRLVGKCPDAVFALEAMRQQPVELLFLDINLPGLKGLEFVRTLLHPPQVILTTAYHEYALEGYALDVVDYLLKPIEFERFMKAIQKLRQPARPPGAPSRAFHFFNVNKKMVRVWLDEILFVESLKEYVRLYLHDGRTLVTKGQLNELEAWLMTYRFWRVHRSFLVALPQVDAYTSAEVFTGGNTIPIGRQYKEQTLEKLAQFSAGN